jgi:hypothetical protein
MDANWRIASAFRCIYEPGRRHRRATAASGEKNEVERQEAERKQR